MDRTLQYSYSLFLWLSVCLSLCPEVTLLVLTGRYNTVTVCFSDSLSVSLIQLLFVCLSFCPEVTLLLLTGRYNTVTLCFSVCLSVCPSYRLPPCPEATLLLSKRRLNSVTPCFCLGFLAPSPCNRIPTWIILKHWSISLAHELGYSTRTARYRSVMTVSNVGRFRIQNELIIDPAVSEL